MKISGDLGMIPIPEVMHEILLHHWLMSLQAIFWGTEENAITEGDWDWDEGVVNKVGRPAERKRINFPAHIFCCELSYFVNPISFISATSWF